MSTILVPCPRCSMAGTDTCEDRHTETRQDICRECGGKGTVPARTGETREASFDPGAEANACPSS